MGAAPKFFLRRIFLLVGGCLLPSLFLWAPAGFSDTILLKDGKELKGLVIEKHFDRVILSTESGEKHVLLAEIEKIGYDDPEQNFMEAGKSFEESGKLEEALAYYEKAAELNPDFEEAKAAAVGVRSRLWAKVTEGPRGEMERQQVLYDRWSRGAAPQSTEEREAVFKKQRAALKQGLGLVLHKEGDWVELDSVSSKKPAALAGLKKGDRLVSIDGKSLRYLGVDSVSNHLLEPRFANFTLELERDIFVRRQKGATTLKKLGLKLSLEYQGTVIQEVLPKSTGDDAGLKEQDLLTQVDGIPTRYTPLNKVIQLIEDFPGKGLVALTVRRSALLSRK